MNFWCSVLVSVRFSCWQNLIVAPMRHCFVDTELTAGTYGAKQQFCRSRFRVGVHQDFPCSFAFQRSSGQGTRSSEHRRPSFCDLQHHHLCCTIPFAVWFVGECPVPFILVSWTEETPMTNVKRVGICRNS